MKTAEERAESEADRQEAIAIRKWALEKALAFRHDDADTVSDLINQAIEIEGYVTKGNNPRRDFYRCVDIALQEVENTGIVGVGDRSRDKIMEVVRKTLQNYDALD